MSGGTIGPLNHPEAYVSRSPLVDAWHRAKDLQRRPLQVPGHKNRFSVDEAALGADLLGALVRDDVPLQGGVDDMAFSNRYLEQAEELWAEAVSATHTRFLVGGSSQGNIAALSTVAHPDRPVAIDRTSHRSTQAALVITGAYPAWVYPTIHPEFHIPVGVPVSALADVDADATAFFVTSPSYVGTMSDVSALAAAVHARGVPLVVDQAWGAHLDFLPGRGATALGADVSVTSIHKALMGYSQTAAISMRDERVTRAHLDRCVDLVSTTSPSGTLFASIDATRAVLERDGGTALDRTMELVREMRRALATVPGLVVLDDHLLDVPMDPFKVTMILPGTGVSGLDLARALYELGHGPESADTDTLVLSITLMDEPDFLREATDLLVRLIESMRAERRTAVPTAVWRVEPEVVVTPRTAFFAKRRRIRLADAAGEVSAEQFCPYPPGVPLLAPGERVTKQTIEAIALAGRIGRVAYSSDHTLETIEVIDDL